jgi:hypothetical protein
LELLLIDGLTFENIKMKKKEKMYMCMKFQGFYLLYIEIMDEWELKWNVDYGYIFYNDCIPRYTEEAAKIWQ